MTDAIAWEDPPPVAAIGPDPEAVRRWVETSCAAQGVPFHVTDRVMLAKVGVLLTGRSPSADASPPRPERLP